MKARSRSRERKRPSYVVSGSDNAVTGVYLWTSEVHKGKPVFNRCGDGAVMSFRPCGATGRGWGWGIRQRVDDFSMYHLDQDCALPPLGKYIKVSDGRGNPRAEQVQVSLFAEPSPVDDVVKTAWKDREFSDSEVVCNGIRFATHRVFLSAASPVFRAAFSSAMAEGRSSVYEIKDSTPRAVETMLEFIYTGTCNLLDSEPEMVLELAVQYELDRLCDKAAQSIIENVTVHNVRNRVLLLKRHGENAFAKSALQDMLKLLREDKDGYLILAAIC